MFQIYYRYLQLKYKINKVLPTIITDFGCKDKKNSIKLK